MKKVVITVMLLVIMVMLGINQVYAAENVAEVPSDSQLIQIKDNAAKTLEEYKQKYGSDAYGWAAYLLNKVRLYSIPLCFLGVAIGAIYQYVIGIRKLDERDKGFGMIITFVTIFGICQILPLVFAIVVKGWRS